MQEQRAQLHRILVRLFNDILRIEEKALAVGEFEDLSVREMHVIEAVAISGDANSMSSIAAHLGITVGSLTVAVSTLVRKGYLKRASAPFDRRVVQVLLTEKGERANLHHTHFHDSMIDEILEGLDPEQMDGVMELTTRLERFFQKYAEMEDEPPEKS